MDQNVTLYTKCPVCHKLIYYNEELMSACCKDCEITYNYSKWEDKNEDTSSKSMD